MAETMVDVQIEDISTVKKKLKFDVSWLEVKKELDAAYREVGKKAKIRGFRQGKIPRHILETLYKDYAEGEAVTNIVNKYYWNTIQERNIAAVSQPHIEQNGIEREKNFVFTATVEVEPDLDPQGYTGLELVKEIREVTDVDVDKRLQEMRSMFSTLEEVESDRGIISGDFAVIDFEGSIEGKALPGMKSDNYLLEIGSRMFVPGFEEQVIGMTRGETKQFQVEFPGDYHEKDLAGKAVTFSVSLKNIKEKMLPEINEQFIKNFNKYETLEELRKDISKNLEKENTARTESVLKDLIIDRLIANNDFEVPPSFIDRQISFMVADTQRRMTLRGMSRERASEFSERLPEMYKEEAMKIVKSSLLMKGIARKESIITNDSEIEERIKEIAEQRGQKYDDVKASLKKANMLDNIRNDILNEKIFAFIEGKAHVTTIKKENEQAGG